MANQSKPKKSYTRELVETLLIIVPIAFLIRTFGYGLYQVPTGSMETTMLVGERFFADKFTVLFREIKHGDIISFNNPTFKYSDNKLKRLFQEYVWGPDNYTKRVIALPGDEIKGEMDAEGKPVIYLKKNGETEFKRLDEPYLNKYPLIPIYKEGASRQIIFRSYDPNFSYEDQPFYRLKKSEVLRGEKLATLFKDFSIRYPATPSFDNTGRNVDVFNVKLTDDEYWVMGDNRLNSNDSRFWGPLKKHFIHGKIVYRIFSIDSESSWLLFDIIFHPIDFWTKMVRWGRNFQTIS